MLIKNTKQILNKFIANKKAMAPGRGSGGGGGGGSGSSGGAGGGRSSASRAGAGSRSISTSPTSAASPAQQPSQPQRPSSSTPQPVTTPTSPFPSSSQSSMDISSIELEEEEEIRKAQKEHEAELREFERKKQEEIQRAEEEYAAQMNKLQQEEMIAQAAATNPESEPVALVLQQDIERKKRALATGHSEKLRDIDSKYSEKKSKSVNNFHDKKEKIRREKAKENADKRNRAAVSNTSSGAGGTGSGNSGLFSKLGSGGASSGSEQKNPWGTVILIILCALGAAFVFYTSDADFFNVWPALISFALFIVGLLFLLFTKGNRGIIVWLVIIIIFALALYFFATRTVPLVIGAVQASGGIGSFTREVVSEGESETTKASTSIVEDIRSSYRRQIAVATGERLDGNVDNSIRDEVGIKILPPYLPNPKKITQPEIPTLEFSSRIKGFDPKTPIHVGAKCHIQSREEADESALSHANRGGPRTALGDEQSIRPDSFEDYSFDREVTCYPALEVSACGDFVITLSAQADNLRTDARMINYIISEEVLKTQLMEYAKSKDIEITSEGQVASAINELYRGELGDFRSVSDKGSIKVIMTTVPVPLIGVNPDAQLDFKLRVAVENALDGWIRGINSLEVIIPEYFSPLPEFCRGWVLNGNILSLSSDSLSRINFDELDRGAQKVFPSCLLVPSGDYELTEPTEATFLAAVSYNYLVQEQFDLEIRDADNQECGRERER
jgi:uncharacterized protein YeaO (DUF488 family)